MTDELVSRLRGAPIIPLIQADAPDVAVAIANALAEGGLTVLEVVLRTDNALRCLERVRDSVPDAIVGAGTVLSVEQVGDALAAGATFLVSPGLYPPVVESAHDAGIDIFPGIATPSEAQTAWNLGVRTMKFFPAGHAGGVGMLKALSAVFRDVSFVPTGGISERNLAEYLKISTVLACGGSWLTPSAQVEQGRFDEITRIARQAMAIAADARA